MQLKDYPQPPKPNGRGFHFGLDVRQANLDAFLPMLKDLGCTVILFYSGDELQTANCAKVCWSLGMLPIIRPKCKIGNSVNWGAHVKAVLDTGAPGAYVVAGNEPGNPDEYQNGHYNHSLFVSWWKGAANAIVAAGGYPGLQTFELEDVQDCFSGLSDAVLDKLWFASHSYASNHPPDYPMDKGLTIFQDDTSALMWLEHADYCYKVLGRYIPVIVTEGGYVIDQQEDNTYPRINDELHAKYSADIFDQFRTGQLYGAASSIKLPDYFFAYCPFLWRDADWMAFAWYLGLNGTRQQTIDAVKSIPKFTRKFSWDTQMTLEETVKAEAAKQTLLPINENAALFKYAVKQGLGPPQCNEVEFTWQVTPYLLQVFSGGIVFCPKGKWDQCAWVKK